jgi:biopolymer transport protein ExbB/TolQ
MNKPPQNAIGDFERQKLDVNLLPILGIALVITIAIYAIIFPFKETYLGILLYDRGPTQHLAIYFASVVVTLIVLKFLKIEKEYKTLKRFWIPDTISFDNPDSKEIGQLQKALVKENHVIALRSSRIIAAYALSGNRKAAAELAVDDSSFYMSASESSYTFPRILIWAIPLLGFIGTVFGISEAVNGFSGLLDKATDIEQIKEGIGTVTGGLAVAFDTTLLALLLSVLVMIPLVLLERFESRFLLSVDVLINDQILPRLKDRSQTDEKAIARSVNQEVNNVLNERLPTPEALIQPASEYAERAASALAENFIREVSKLQQVSVQLVSQLGHINQMALSDRQNYISAIELSQESDRHLVAEIRTMVESVKAMQSETAQGLSLQAQQITTQLDRASALLEERVYSLEKATLKISEMAKLQQILEEVFSSLERMQSLDRAMLEIKEGLMQLKPTLEKLGKPRMITYVEPEEGSV